MLKKILLVIAGLMAIGLVLSVLKVFPSNGPFFRLPAVEAAPPPTGAVPVTPSSTVPPTKVPLAPSAGPMATPPTPTLAPAAAKDLAAADPLPAEVPAPPIFRNGLTQFFPQTVLQEPPFLVQSGTPAFLKNFSHPDQGCQWLSVAGQVLDSQGKAGEAQPVSELVVSVLGILDGNVVDHMTLTGMAPEYGPGGFEVQLANRPIASTHAVWLQVYSLDGHPVTAPEWFDTRADCAQNVVLINLKR